jgi:hypothetical protein
MFRLGFRLSWLSGREALIRLILTTAAVAAGVALLLAVLADFRYPAASRTYHRARQCTL